MCMNRDFSISTWYIFELSLNDHKLARNSLACLHHPRILLHLHFQQIRHEHSKFQLSSSQKNISWLHQKISRLITLKWLEKPTIKPFIQSKTLNLLTTKLKKDTNTLSYCNIYVPRSNQHDKFELWNIGVWQWWIIHHTEL